jgi:hypothetical protein
LTADGAGNLHLVGLGRDERGAPALLYALWRWEEERWEEQDLYRVAGAQDSLPGVAVALLGAEGRLDAAFRARLEGEGETRSDVLYARRTVAAVAESPEPAYTAVPTATPTPAPTFTPSPTPRAQVGAEPPLAGPPTVGLGPLTLPLIAVAGLGLAVIIIVIVLVTRKGGAGR